MKDILDRILETKREEVAALRRSHGQQALSELAAAAGPVRGFAARLDEVAESGPAVIAEIKKASPSRGVIREQFDAAQIAREYAGAGAACLSVLTDAQYFQGSAEDLAAARQACPLPLLRKDFTIDPLQVLEARAMGADAVLLIVAALSDGLLSELHDCARELGLDVLVEVHTRVERDRALRTLPEGGWLLGINNRDLRSFITHLSTTVELVGELPPGVRVVSESGIGSAADIAMLQQHGVRRFLIGERLMRESSPGAALRALIAPQA